MITAGILTKARLLEFCESVETSPKQPGLIKVKLKEGIDKDWFRENVCCMTLTVEFVEGNPTTKGD